jgi:hypothetical protein
MDFLLGNQLLARGMNTLRMCLCDLFCRKSTRLDTNVMYLLDKETKRPELVRLYCVH